MKKQELRDPYDICYETCVQDLVTIITSFLEFHNEYIYLRDLSFGAFKRHWSANSCFIILDIVKQNISDPEKLLFNSILGLLHFPCKRIIVENVNLKYQLNDTSKVSIPLLQTLWNICVIYTLYIVFGTQSHTPSNVSPIWISIDQMIELRLALDRIGQLGVILSEDAIRLYHSLVSKQSFVVSESITSFAIKRFPHVLIKDQTTNREEYSYQKYIALQFSDVEFDETVILIDYINQFSWVHNIDIIANDNIKFTVCLNEEYQKTISKLSQLYRTSVDVSMHESYPVSVSSGAVSSRAKKARKETLVERRKQKDDIKYLKVLGPIPNSDQITNTNINSKPEKVNIKPSISDFINFREFISFPETIDDYCVQLQEYESDSVKQVDDTTISVSDTFISNPSVEFKAVFEQQPKISLVCDSSDCNNFNTRVMDLLQQLESHTRDILGSDSSIALNSTEAFEKSVRQSLEFLESTNIVEKESSREDNLEANDVLNELEAQTNFILSNLNHSRKNRNIKNVNTKKHYESRPKDNITDTNEFEYNPKNKQTSNINRKRKARASSRNQMEILEQLEKHLS